jgi:hypothetical protein
MRGSQTDELARSDDLGLFPELREMPLIASDEVIRVGGVGAFEKHIVVRVAADLKAARRGDDMAVVLDELQQPQSISAAYMEVRT